MEYEKALEIATSYLWQLKPYCERVAIAGSIRRKKAVVKDIEIVAEPKWIPDMFGYMEPSKITQRIGIGMDKRGAKMIKGGDRYIQYELIEGIKLDLFVVRPPAQWGVIMAIRTGPAQFSKWIVTKRVHGGALPSYMKVKNGAIHIRHNAMNCAKETDFFTAIGIEWIEPEERWDLEFYEYSRYIDYE